MTCDAGDSSPSHHFHHSSVFNFLLLMFSSEILKPFQNAFVKNKKAVLFYVRLVFKLKGLLSATNHHPIAFFIWAKIYKLLNIFIFVNIYLIFFLISALSLVTQVCIWRKKGRGGWGGSRKDEWPPSLSQ